MSAETHRLRSAGHGDAADVVVGSASGLVAGIIGGIVLQLVGARHVLTRAVPALVGLEAPAPVAGWMLFVLMSLGFGVAYSGLLAAAGRDVTRPTRGALAGAAYGFVLWLTVAVVFVPLATGTVGYAGAPPLPYVDPVALAGYLAYGGALGAFHEALTDHRAGAVDSGRTAGT